MYNNNNNNNIVGIKTQLHWADHILRMKDNPLPKALLLDELAFNQHTRKLKKTDTGIPLNRPSFHTVPTTSNG